MTKPSDMTTAVTRGELREELDAFRIAFGTELRAEWRADLETWGGALRAELKTGLTELRTELRSELMAELRAELARHVKSFEEFTRSMIIAIDDKYKDLPPRVTRLETEVLAPKRRKR